MTWHMQSISWFTGDDKFSKEIKQILMYVRRVPEELVVQINVEPATDETSLRILNHQISKHPAFSLVVQ